MGRKVLLLDKEIYGEYFKGLILTLFLRELPYYSKKKSFSNTQNDKRECKVKVVQNVYNYY